MKTLIATLLVSSIAFADSVQDTDSPVMAPDIEGVSVRLKAGETAPFDGRLLALDENLRRGRKMADCEAELADAKTNIWTSKPVLISILIGGLVLGAAAGAGVTYYVLQPKP